MRRSVRRQEKGTGTWAGTWTARAGGLPVLLLVFALAAGQAFGDNGSQAAAASNDDGKGAGPRWYLDQAAAAVEREFYDQAVRLYRQGQEAFPQNLSLRMGLGDLYSDQDLYTMALGEYRAAEALDRENYEVLSRLGETLGYLTRDAEAAEVFERLVALYPDDRYALADLGWLLFKTYRLEEGVRLLEDAIARLGPDLALLHTLATLHSGLYSYGRAKELYLRTAFDAEAEGRMQFAAIACYNLSLLERAFYRFEDGLVYAERSLELADRAPGHLSLGELYQGRLDHAGAEREYLRAFQLDTSPLAKICLADLSLETGRPEEALGYLTSAERGADASWMYNFGTDRDRYRMDLEELYAKTFRALAWRERFHGGSAAARIASALRSLVFHVRAWYHDERWKDLARTVGRSHLREGNELDGYWSLYRGSTGRRRLAAGYLGKARELELSLTPRSLPYYLVEEGKTNRDPDLVLEGIAGFDPEWEASEISKGYRIAAPLLRAQGRWAEYYEVCRRLWTCHPQAFAVSGLPVPLVLSVSGASPGSGGKARIPAGLKRALRRCGFFFPRTERDKIPFALMAEREGGIWRVSIVDREGSTLIGSFSADPGLFGGGFYDSARVLVEKIHRITVD